MFQLQKLCCSCQCVSSGKLEGFMVQIGDHFQLAVCGCLPDWRLVALFDPSEG